MRHVKFDPPSVMAPAALVAQPTPTEPLTVRIATAVKLTGISRSKIYELIKEQELETVKIGSSTLIIFESLRRLIESHRS